MEIFYTRRRPVSFDSPKIDVQLPVSEIEHGVISINICAVKILYYFRIVFSTYIVSITILYGFRARSDNFASLHMNNEHIKQTQKHVIELTKPIFLSPMMDFVVFKPYVDQKMSA